ncbi:hypothetical protein E3N88_42107 [Mikania micrantha]|uniref:Serine-threonine/tyrosine-protein kinase catalytic domain-containing protein n=1 Tax=Mikania micrantha TaxID=192012 RepID=A0A5N6LIU2_9ASTR|nr:hypothetical protein E3N88_42107 [Mikania micrantha]
MFTVVVQNWWNLKNNLLLGTDLSASNHGQLSIKPSTETIAIVHLNVNYPIRRGILQADSEHIMALPWHVLGDSDLKVMGVGSLLLIGGYMFLVSPSTNPQATIMMLGSGYITLERTAYGKLSEKLDVHSYGVLLLEIVSKMPNRGMQTSKDMVDPFKRVYTSEKPGTTAPSLALFHFRRASWPASSPPDSLTASHVDAWTSPNTVIYILC